ncbi:MAG: hypothetical protein EOO85_02720 [Pedobacter sp.]|nr:MAG: hypothetical protein EOO85_02720 [Pedobacter sp.]
MNEDYTKVDTLFSNYELMQFTGLKDKNGKEIYEGDILLHKGAKGVVVFNSELSMFMVSFKLLVSTYSFDSIHGSVEVIGNIHENPELLNA